MVLRHFGCLQERELESSGLHARVRAFFKDLRVEDSAHETLSFDPDTRKGRSNIAHITAYTVQQAKCSQPDSSLTKAKTMGFEVLKCAVIVLLLWKIVAYAMRDFGGPDLISQANRTYEVVEACLMLLLGVSLLAKFDTSAFTMSRITVRQAALLLVGGTVLGTAFSVLRSNFEHWRLKAASASALIVVVVLVLFVRHSHADRKLSEEANAHIASYNKSVAPRLRLSEIKWRRRIPTFTDSVFISIAACLLINTAITKLQSHRKPSAN